MCELTTLMMVAGAASSGLSIVGQNQAITAQMEETAAATNRSYQENEMRRGQEHMNALEDAHVSSIERDKAESRAIVRNSTLGIAGTTGREMVGEELRAGNYNVTAARRSMDDAEAALVMGNQHTAASSRATMRGLDSQRTGLLGGLLGIATGGLEGYMLGSRASDAFGSKTPWKKGP